MFLLGALRATTDGPEFCETYVDGTHLVVPSLGGADEIFFGKGGQCNSRLSSRQSFVGGLHVFKIISDMYEHVLSPVWRDATLLHVDEAEILGNFVGGRQPPTTTSRILNGWYAMLRHAASLIC